MEVLDSRLPGLILMKPRVFGDERGFFMESWNQRRYQDAGVPEGFVQDNLSFSRRGILRGLHFQNPNPQGKLVSVLQGEVFDVAVDIRQGSPTFGQWEGFVLSSENKHQLYVPEGFAHGFCVTSEMALFAYKCTRYYAPEHEASILWNDPDIGIQWPEGEVELSAKDREAFCLSDVPADRLPHYLPAMDECEA